MSATIISSREMYETPIASFCLEITLYEGRNLVPKDKHLITRKNVSSDPYVRLYHGTDLIGTTEVKKKTLNPTWNHTFKEIKVDSNRNRHALGKTDSNLLFRMYDQDPYPKKDDFMGETVVPLSFEEPLTEHETTSWYDVGTGDEKCKKWYCHDATGQIRVRITVSKIEGLGIVPGCVFDVPDNLRLTLTWETETGHGITDIDNSCVAINAKGDILMDESVFSAHEANSNGSIRRFEEEDKGGKFVTKFILNLNSVQLKVRALYFIVTVVAPGMTLKDLKTLMVKTSDEANGHSVRRCMPDTSQEHTAMFLLRVTRGSYVWTVSLIEETNHTARDFGTLIPEIKGYSRDINPDIELNQNQRTAIMRPGRSIRIKDYENGAVERCLTFGLTREIIDKQTVGSSLSVVCLNRSLDLAANISTVIPTIPNESIRYYNTDDDERIKINLHEVSSCITYLGFMMNSSSGQNLDSVKKAKCNLYDSNTGINLASYNIEHNSLQECTSLMMACLYRDSGDWNLRILGQGITGDVVNAFQSFIGDIPAPQPAVVSNVSKTETIKNRMPSHS